MKLRSTRIPQADAQGQYIRALSKLDASNPEVCTMYLNIATRVVLNTLEILKVYVGLGTCQQTYEGLNFARKRQV